MKIFVTIGHVFTGAWQLKGFRALCLALFDQLEVVESIMARLGSETLKLLERVLTRRAVGAVCFQDDIAYTSGLMIRPEALRTLFFPWLQKAADLCHSSGRPLILHSDVKVDSVILGILAAGVGVLHPIEPKCMDIAAVKRAYGDRLALMGNLDLGYTLSRGTPEEVRAAVRDLIRMVAPGGGFLLGSANSITDYVPLVNYQALLDAASEFGV